ncbi:MAG: RNA methyltransferase [Hyphomonadaceae bacterium]|nr:RNA methyltransferase [Clostridia bacterium]
MQPIFIESQHNQMIKHIQKLERRAYREKAQEFLLEGERLIQDALSADAPISCILLSNTFHLSQAGQTFLQNISIKGLTIYVIADNIFDKVANTQTPQGILAVAKMPQMAQQDLLNGTNNFFLYLDCVSDPGNMGTILRTADAAGVAGVFLSKGCVDVYNDKTVRSTMGALFHVPIVQVDDAEALFLQFKQNGIQLLSGDLSAQHVYYDADMSGGLCIAVGNEAEGISQLVRDYTALPVKIIMPGLAESLNVAVAAGILMFEAVKQRALKK